MNKFGVLNVGDRLKNSVGESLQVTYTHDNDGEYKYRVRRLTKISEITGRDEYDITIDGKFYHDGRISELDANILAMAQPTNQDAELVRIARPRFSLGCDPEILLRNDQSCVAAINYTANSNSEFKYGSYGVDGCTYLLEFRPREAHTPYALTRNIQSVFKRACKNNEALSNVIWMAGPGKLVPKEGQVDHGYSTGGHIHFGLKRAPFMIPMLDKYLAAFYMLLEDERDAKVRKLNREYGQLGDCRRQDWGFEYRTLSSWVYSPGVALAVLSTAKHIINQFQVPNNEVFNREKVRQYLDLSMQLQFRQHDTTYFQSMFKWQWNELRSWPTEPSLKKGLDMFEMLVQTGFKIDDVDIKRNWGIVK